MWKEKYSLVLSKLCCCLFMAVLVLFAFAAPNLVNVWLVHIAYGREWMFLLTIYSGIAAAVVLLCGLFALLHSIGKGEVFIPRNTRCLRLISWCCFIGALICLASAFYHWLWVVIAVAAAFMGVILRVLKNVFARAVELQDDAEFTI